MFVSFEGVDGSGKTTQIERVYQRLKDCGHHVIKTKEPGGSFFGGVIRDILVGEDGGRLDDITKALLFMADRRQHVRDVIRPALINKSIVLCDRFIDSTLVYQLEPLAKDPESDLSDISSLEDVIYFSSDIQPNLTIVLDLNAEESIKRLQARTSSNSMDSWEVQEIEEKRKGFLNLSRYSARHFVIDASFSERLITDIIIERIEKELKIKKLQEDEFTND